MFYINRAIVSNEFEKHKPAPKKEEVATEQSYASWAWSSLSRSVVPAEHTTKTAEDAPFWADKIEKHRQQKRLVRELHESICKSIRLFKQIAVDWKANKKYAIKMQYHILF